MMDIENNVKKSAVQAEDEPQIKISKGKAYGFLGILWLLFFFDIVVRNGINPLFTVIQKDLGLTDGQLGLIGSAVLLGVTVFVIPISYLSDRWSKSKTIGIMSFFWSICAIASGLAKNFAVMITSRIGVGVGEASYGPSAVSLISSFFGKSKWGKVLAIFNSAQPIALCVGIILTGVFNGIFGWRGALIIFGIPSLLLGFLAFKIPEHKVKLRKSSGEASKSKANFTGSFKLLLTNKSLLVMCLSYGLTYIIISGSQTWLATYMVRYLNYTVSQSTTLTGIMALIGIPAYALGGFIIDRLYKKDLRSRMWFAAICAVLSSSCCFIGFKFVSIPFLFIAFFLVFAAFPVTVSISSQEVVPFWNKTLSFGILAFIANIFAMFGPTLVGYISQLSDLRVALTYVQFIAILSALGYVTASITYIKDFNRARHEESEFNKANKEENPLSPLSV